MRKERTHFSFYSDKLSISTEVPATWDVVISEDFALALLQKETNEFRSNVGFNIYKFSGTEESKFEDAIASTKLVLKKEYNKYRFIDEQRGWIDGYPAYLQEYSWIDDISMRSYFQISCLINVIPDKLYEITCTSLLGGKKEITETFHEILNSFRYIESTELS